MNFLKNVLKHIIKKSLIWIIVVIGVVAVFASVYVWQEVLGLECELLIG